MSTWTTGDIIPPTPASLRPASSIIGDDAEGGHFSDSVKDP